MMRLFVNAVAASAGGGLTYIRNVIPRLAAQSDLHITVAISPAVHNEFRQLTQINVVNLSIPPARRYWYEHSRLPALIRKSNADILLSTGNFALRNSPVPQILLSRNSIYCSHDFYSDLLSRREFHTWLDTHFRALLAKRSLAWADITVAPSHAFAEELRQWSGYPVRAIHHGFDFDEFFRDATPLTDAVKQQLDAAAGSLRLLFVSHYNYYRNFETLIRALPLIRRAIRNRPVKLLLTCKLCPGQNPGTYNPQQAAKLVKELGVEEMVIELGTIPYRQLHHLYRQCHIYVTPAYAETFAHPVVEAMASGLPVIASNIAVHREIAGEASAIFFDRFSAEELAASVIRIADNPQMADQMSAAGKERSRHFSWHAHVDQLLELARILPASRR